ncbi:MAG: S66 peptidase family protein [Oligoflexus sp.]
MWDDYLGQAMSRAINLRLIYPASKDKEDTSVTRKIELKNGSLQLNRLCLPTPSPWQHLSASLADRLQELIEAIESDEHVAIICGRGGYGASDLLPHLPWERWQNRPGKLIIGFSDISALHAAFYTKLGWPGLHAPMPATNYWSEHPESDLPLLYQALTQPELPIGISLQGNNAVSTGHQGTLFGGCLSVLTNLIGTPYLPSSLARHILFWEDIDEPMGRIFRNVNQWQQSGVLAGVEAIILGQFTLKQNILDLPMLADEISQRTGIAVYTSLDFGHCSPNMPLMIGGQAEIINHQLIWKRSLLHGTLTT